MEKHRLFRTLGVSALAVAAAVGSALQAQTTPAHKGHKHHKHHTTNVYVGATAVIPPGPRNDIPDFEQRQEAQMQLEQAAGALDYQRNTAGAGLTDTRTPKQIEADKKMERQKELDGYNPVKPKTVTPSPQ